MPNWCVNFVSISGKKENLKKVRDFLIEHKREDDSLMLEEIVEKLYKGEGKDYSAIAGSRRVVISDIDNKIPEEEESYFSITLESAWSDCSRLLVLIGREFTIEITSDFEEGQSFKGSFTYFTSGVVQRIYYDNYWEGMANLEPEDYIDFGQNEFDCFDSYEDFKESDIYKQCPDNLKEEFYKIAQEFYDERKTQSND